MRELRRVAIVNRGEAAMRLIHAVRELNARAGLPGALPTPAHPIETIALHTDGERTAMFVREADHAHNLGPAAERPYLDHARLERALRATGADAAWVGWGFVAEDPAFAELCERIGVTFVGPSPDAMRRLGDKIGAKLAAEAAGVPVAPWSGGALDTLDDALACAGRLGYPLMLKAAAGGGGRGIRTVRSDADLTDVFDRTREEALRSFGSDVVFLESLVTGARHVEVQLIADGHGTAWGLGVRDCSVQRRNQKVLEESASPLLDAEQVEALKDSAARLALSVGYCGAGTAEFLYSPAEKQLAFLEVNTRLQVEHSVTELTTGVDLVALQLHVAAGGRLTDIHPARPEESGHAIEARLNAEDAERDFAPAPGRVALLRLPTGPGVRIDTGIAEGDTIPPEFDSMIAKVIAHGADRPQAIARLRRALEETTVVVEGGATNRSFLLDLLHRGEVVAGEPIWADTGWIDRERAGGGLAPRHVAGLALVTAAIDSYDADQAGERRAFLASARGGRPQARHDAAREYRFALGGRRYTVTVAQVAPGGYRVAVDGVQVEAALDRLDAFAGRLRVEGHEYRVVSAAHPAGHLVEVDGVTHRVTPDSGGVIASPAPALVVALPVRAGAEVEAGAPVAVLESMKMETVLAAPSAGRVREVHVAEGDQVGAGQPVLSIEPLTAETDEEPAEPEPVDLGLDHGHEPDADPRARALSALADLRHLLLGFDVPAEQARALVAEYQRLRTADPGPLLAAEVDLLAVFADLAELSRNRPVGGDAEPGELDASAHSPREYFHRYLHSLDADRERLPDSFRAKLSRALAHFGLTSLEHTGALEEAVYRLFLAQQQAGAGAQAAAVLLERWLADPLPGAGLREAVRDVLDRLVVAAQVRHPAVGDLARSARFRWFETPLTEAARAATYAQARIALARLDAGLADGLDDLVNCPEPVVGLLAERLGAAGPADLARVPPLLEVMVRRHYREFALQDLEQDLVGAAGEARPVLRADYAIDGRPTRLVSTVAHDAELDDADGALAALLAAELDDAPAGAETVVDLYVGGGDPARVDALPADLAERLARLPRLTATRRVTVAVCWPDPARNPVQQLTFRPAQDGEGLAEDRLLHGLHPMTGRRLDLWRLRDFAVTRLDAPADVLLYRCVAPGNDADERLVALGQVRELSIVRGEGGKVIALPQIERSLAACLDAVRQARRPRQDHNHVWLHIWPEIAAEVSELTAITPRIAPLTAGAGIAEAVVQGRIARPKGGPRPVAARFDYRAGRGVQVKLSAPPTTPLAPLDDYAQKVLRSARRGTVYPYEIVPLLTSGGGTFTELDLDETSSGPDVLTPADRAPGGNTAGLVVGLVSSPTARVPEGVRRVVLLGDPTKNLGAVAEAECRRIVAALDLAERERIPLEWFALSAGARISMTSGTENMDWVARALRRIIEFTQAGGEINIVITGITVGAQPYWNAEATMLMHTKGILVMTPDGAMVLTGKASLDYSGGVSAEDNQGIGGYDRVMGPNGQAQYWADDLAGAVAILRAHYEHAYVPPGESAARRATTTDPFDRDVCAAPHPGAEFATVGEIFSAATNPERKKPFDIRTVMRAVADADHPTLERWGGMADAETAVVLDAHLGGHPVCLLGIESRPLPRRGLTPTDGPDAWTAGTLFPRSSKKAARAINAASGSRPVVVLANLSGFDGSPESMRRLQLEYGAEIGRAVTNFAGRIVFCVVSRYHGGAFVVFSKALNENMTVLAVEGSYASVIGGAPAAGVVLTAEVDARTAADPRIRAMERYLANGGTATDAERALQRAELAELRGAVRAEKLREVATEFDAVHSIERAVAVGSVDAVIPASRLRPALIEALDGAPAP